MLFLGQYALAYKILMLPIALLGGAMFKVNFRNFSKAYNEGKKLSHLVLIEWGKAFLMALPVAIFLYFTGEKLLSFVFGDKWDIAGQYLSILAFPLAISFIFSITSCLHVVLRLQHYSFAVSVVSLLCKIAVVYVFSASHFNMVLGIFLTDVFIVVLFNLYVFLILMPGRHISNLILSFNHKADLNYEKILVTGGLGQIGSHITELCLAQNMEVLVIDNLATGREEHLSAHDKLQIKLGSIADKELVDSCFAEFKPDIVVHTAASYKDPNDWYNDTLTNCVGGATLLRLLWKMMCLGLFTSKLLFVMGLNQKSNP